MEYTITITQEVLNKSTKYVKVDKKRPSQYCPIALAVSIALGFPVEFNGLAIELLLDSKISWITLPKECGDFATKFDRNEVQTLKKPIAFSIEIPENIAGLKPYGSWLVQ